MPFSTPTTKQRRREYLLLQREAKRHLTIKSLKRYTRSYQEQQSIQSQIVCSIVDEVIVDPILHFGPVRNIKLLKTLIERNLSLRTHSRILRTFPIPSYSRFPRETESLLLNSTPFPTFIIRVFGNQIFYHR